VQYKDILSDPLLYIQLLSSIYNTKDQARKLHFVNNYRLKRVILRHMTPNRLKMLPNNFNLCAD